MSAIKNYKIMIVITIYNLNYDINIFMFRKDNNISYSWVQIKFLKSKFIRKNNENIIQSFSDSRVFISIKKNKCFR